MTAMILSLVIPALGFAAGTGLYDSARQPGWKIAVNALTILAWLAALRAFFALS